MSELNQFVTLFDSRYLSRGLALYRSLERHCGDFTLRAVCMDAESAVLLRRLAPDRLEVIELAELEAHDTGLRAVRNNRSTVEYFWTATPCVCLLALEREPDLPAVTYLDADLLFFNSPDAIFSELDDQSILLVPHRWAPEHRRHETGDGTSDEAWGIFNVQFMTFRRDAKAMAALRWWRERCLESCLAAVHPGRFGDQKYLDDWPERFAGVRVLEHVGAGLAPWNVSQYDLGRAHGRIRVDGLELIFHHYQGLWLHPPTPFARLLAKGPSSYCRGPSPPGWAWSVRWGLSQAVIDLLWAPYVQRVSEAAMELAALGASPYLGMDRLTARTALGRLVRRHLPRPLRRTYWQVRRAARRAAEPPRSVTTETR